MQEKDAQKGYFWGTSASDNETVAILVEWYDSSLPHFYEVDVAYPNVMEDDHIKIEECPINLHCGHDFNQVRSDILSNYGVDIVNANDPTAEQYLTQFYPN